jgi:hypothetical protein
MGENCSELDRAENHPRIRASQLPPTQSKYDTQAAIGLGRVWWLILCSFAALVNAALALLPPMLH